MNGELINNKKLYIIEVTNADKTKTYYRLSSKLELEKALGLRQPKYSYGTDIEGNKVNVENIINDVEIYCRQEYKLTSNEKEEINYKNECKNTRLSPAIFISEEEFNRMNKINKVENKEILNKIKKQASAIMAHSTYNGKHWDNNFKNLRKTN